MANAKCPVCDTGVLSNRSVCAYQDDDGNDMFLRGLMCDCCNVYITVAPDPDGSSFARQVFENTQKLIEDWRQQRREDAINRANNEADGVI